MAEEKADANATRTVRISNTGTGPRYVHTVAGPVTVRPGTTSGEHEVRVAELDALPDGLVEGEADFTALAGAGVRTIDTGGAAEGVDGSGTVGGEGEGEERGEGGRDIPDDLASTRSADGIVGLEKLQEVAKAEGVEFESDDNKADLLAKIVAHRGASGS